MKKAIRVMIAVIYAAAFATMAESWGICYAYIERGYKAVGGEYFFFPIVFVRVYKALSFMFRALEDTSERSKTNDRSGEDV